MTTRIYVTHPYTLNAHRQEPTYVEMAAQPGHDAALIVGISGPSSSGKTTLARLLQTVFGGLHESLKTFIIHEDDFYLPDDK